MLSFLQSFWFAQNYNFTSSKNLFYLQNIQMIAISISAFCHGDIYT